MKVYAVVFLDAYEGSSIVVDLYLHEKDAEAHVTLLRRERELAGIPWPARYQVEEREVLSGLPTSASVPTLDRGATPPQH